MEKEIKLNRGWRLTKYTDSASRFLACDAKLDIFIHANSAQLSNPIGGETFLNLRADGKIIASIWLTTQTAIKRVENLLKEA